MTGAILCVEAYVRACIYVRINGRTIDMRGVRVQRFVNDNISRTRTRRQCFYRDRLYAFAVAKEGSDNVSFHGGPSCGGSAGAWRS